MSSAIHPDQRPVTSPATQGGRPSGLERARERVRGEYLEMPGMKLQPAQVQRLCGVDPSVCKEVLDALVDAKFLSVRPDGAYARSTDRE